MESMISEDLKEIPGFAGYYININGEVFSTKHYNKLTKMVLREDKDGYYEVGMYKNKKRYFRRVHRLVLEAFSSNPNNLTQVNHKDGNKKNNNIDNLEWCTCQDNMIHSFRVLHRIPNITTNKKIILTDKETGEQLKFFSIKECAKFLGMSFEHLGRIINGSKNIDKCRKLKSYNINVEV